MTYKQVNAAPLELRTMRSMLMRHTEHSFGGAVTALIATPLILMMVCGLIGDGLDMSKRTMATIRVVSIVVLVFAGIAATFAFLS